MFKERWQATARPEKPQTEIAEKPFRHIQDLSLAELVDKYYVGAWDKRSAFTNHHDYVLTQAEIIKNMAREIEKLQGFEPQTAEALAAQIYTNKFAGKFKNDYNAYSN